MTTMRMVLPLAGATLAAAAAMLSAGGSAMANDSGSGGPGPVQAQIDAQLRDYPGGVQSGPNEISYKNGRVLLTFPSEGGNRAAPNPCAANRYCFYQDKNFEGRKLTFADCGGTQTLVDYGFGNKTSSWQNKTKSTVEVFDENVQPWKLLWTEVPSGASSYVGDTANDKADSFTTYCPR